MPAISLRTPRGPTFGRRSRRRLFRRRLALVGALALAAALTLSVVTLNGAPARARQEIVLSGLQGVLARISVARLGGEPAATRVAAAQRLVARAVPAREVIRRGAGSLVFDTDVAATARSVLERLPAGGAVTVAQSLQSVRIAAPVIRQNLKNDCEAAALSVLLATLGTRVDQRRLLDLLPRSGPLDPDDSGPVRVWGDPDRGFVGRPDGGGPAGGFGVYQGPVRDLAARQGRPLVDLAGARLATIYERLRSGRAVMAWVGLSDGPYGSWISPAGRDIRVNFGEHTLVLTGYDADGSLLVVNPLTGRLERWSRTRFALAWERLGRRALAGA